MTIGVLSRTKVSAKVGDLCPRCSGLLNWQWNVALRVEELHCVTCGNLPNQRIAQKERACVECWLRPVACGGEGVSVEEATRCAGCRQRWNAKRRMGE
jgi:hypothetical protein